MSFIKRKALLIDPDKCIACRSCQVSCKEWNQLPAKATINRGGFENPADLDADLYNRIRFIENETPGAENRMEWLFFSQRCMHCNEAGCVKVCPSGALSHSKTGTVAIDKSKCIGCKYCHAGCPFEIPRYDADGKISKCDLCQTRIEAGMEPACAKTCPTDSIRFGDWDTLAAEVTASGKTPYGVKELGGTGVMYALSKPPEAYGLPANPAIPANITLWRDIIRPLGWLGLGTAAAAVIMHYVTIGPKNIVHDDENGGV